MSKIQLQVDVSVIISNGEGKILLMQRPAHDKNFPLYWGIPGGGVEEEDNSLEEAAAREIMEEVGVSVKNLKLFVSNINNERNVLFLIFTADYHNGSITPDPHEVMQAGWYSLSELEDKQYTPHTKEYLMRVLTDGK